MAIKGERIMKNFKELRENDEIYPIMQEWIEKENPRIILIETIGKTPCFGSYDAWKTASPDDYYDEVETEVEVDINDFYDFWIKYADFNDDEILDKNNFFNSFNLTLYDYEEYCNETYFD
jgi:hypothetical protein